MDAATRAESSDSIAANAATAKIGPTRVDTTAQSKPGTDGAGRELGSSPMRANGRFAHAVTSETTTIAMIDPGNCL